MEFDLKDYDYCIEYDFDREFWKGLVLPDDVKEAIEENVRDSIDVSEWVD